MESYVCIYISGSSPRDTAKALLERGIATKADTLERYPMFIRNNRIDYGARNDSVMLFVEETRLDEAMAIMESLNTPRNPVSAFVLPVLRVMGEMN